MSENSILENISSLNHDELRKLATAQSSMIQKLSEALRKMSETSERRDEKVRNLEKLVEELRSVGHNDPLTGVLNRRGMEIAINNSLKRKEAHGTLVYLDLNKFKFVNDYISHDAGDEILIKLCKILSARLRPTDLISRVGGDEFVIFLLGADVNTAKRIINEILEICHNINLEHENVSVFKTITNEAYFLDFSAGFTFTCHPNPKTFTELMNLGEQSVPKFIARRCFS